MKNTKMYLNKHEVGEAKLSAFFFVEFGFYFHCPCPSPTTLPPTAARGARAVFPDFSVQMDRNTQGAETNP